MTREEIMALLRNPDQTGKSVDELNRLIEEYSYFHTGHQLYLQSLKQTDETQLTHQLNKSALNVRDRELLYNYINRPNAFRQQTMPPQDNIEEVVTPFAPGNAFITPESETTTAEAPQPIVTSDAPKKEQNSSPSSSPTTDVEKIRKNVNEYIVAEEKIMSNDELMKVIQRQLETIDPSETHHATDVIEHSEPISIDPTVAESSVQTETNVTIQGESNKEATNSNLIDSFLSANPKIIPSDSDFQVDLATSLQSDPDIASDTLADIYASQGHIQKAIEIYEHLILKYPEKHIYFAAQIDRLKQELI